MVSIGEGPIHRGCRFARRLLRATSVARSGRKPVLKALPFFFIAVSITHTYIESLFNARLLLWDAMGDTTMNVPVKVRTHELQQVKTMMPNVADALEQADLDEAAAEVQRIFDTHVEGIDANYPEGGEFAAYLSMPVEDWRLTIRHLNRARRTDGKLRTQWLQSKLVDRVEDRLTEMEDDA